MRLVLLRLALLVVAFAALAFLFWLFPWLVTIILWMLAALLALVLLLLPLRIQVRAQYDKDGPLVYGGLGPVWVKAYPRPEEGPKKEKKKKKEKPEKEPEEPVETGGSVEQLKAGLSIVGPIYAQVRRRLMISEITLHYTIATDDAAKTAMRYGTAHAAVTQILSLIRGQFEVKRQDVQINADFSGGGDLVLLRVGLSISVWGAMRIGLFAYRKARKSGLIQKGAKHGQASHQRV